MFTLEDTNRAALNSTTDSQSAGTAISGGYDGNSLTLKILVVLFPSLSIYNALELLVLIFFTFNKYKGVYFWSLLISSLGIIPYSLGFLFKYANITSGKGQWLGVVFLTPGWWTMVTGQSVVLWSRLHLLLEGERGQRTLQWTKWMIIIDAIVLHLPTTVLTFGSNGDVDTAIFVRGYNIMEKIQMSGFFIQEVILSCIYIAATLRILRTSIRENTKRLMWQLMLVNVIIIGMDLALLGLEAASLYLLETLLKSVIYSIKLKLEFAILGKLVQFVGRPGTSVHNDERTRAASVTFFGHDLDRKLSRETSRSTPSAGVRPGIASDFVELSKLRTTVTHDTQQIGQQTKPDFSSANLAGGRKRTRAESVRLPPGMTMDDVNFAMFQHTEDDSLHGAEGEADESAPHNHSRDNFGVSSHRGDAAV